MVEKKLNVITSPTFAYCFTLFSLACTAVFVFSDHRPSFPSLSLLFPTNFLSTTSSSPHNYSVDLLNSNGDVESESRKGITVNVSNSTATSSPQVSSVDLLNNETVSGKGKMVNVLNSNATSSPDNQVRASNGSVSGNYSVDLSNSGNVSEKGKTVIATMSGEARKKDLGDSSFGLLNNGTVESESEKGKMVNVEDEAIGNGRNEVLTNETISDGSILSNSSANLLNNGNIESGSEKGKTVNVTENGEATGNPDQVSNNSIIGFLSNSSVSLLDKKDGRFHENYDKTRTGSSVNGTLENGSEKGKRVNAALNGETTVLSNETITDNQSNSSSNLMNQTVNSESMKGKTVNQRRQDLWEKMKGCDFFDGNWVKDDSYPLYKPGSCPHIDEPFDCFRNGRPDNDYEKFRWQPKGCDIPRLNGRDLLEILRGKRLVYVGDSLNRNMWESMVCTLRNVVKDKRRVFEASGKRDFRTEHSYSFIFLDYNCSVEFFRSTFLVREWDVEDTNGLKQETLRLDMVARSFNRFKDADILVFNTGHWWTHEKTAKGKGYYQEGSHVYDELNVIEAFRRAMTTWGRWIDNNVNPKKTLVVFRGYSASHFSGGQWNSGGQCDSETVPIKNETYLKGYPSKMIMFEKVMSGMSTPVLLLNVTKMTDFRKDAHPSVYRSQHLTEEERKSPLRFQDCSHWCLPGIPETWNELLYAQIFTKYKL